MKTACIITLGCKVNQYESLALGERLELMDYQVFYHFCKADIYILNTCAVTNESERKSRQVVAKFNKLNPTCKIFVCGCASQNNPEQFINLPNVKYIIGNANKYALIDRLDKKGKKIFKCGKAFEDMIITKSNHTRAFIKIQEGCNRYCSYCLIPYIRGPSRSREIISILNEVAGLVKNGTREIVLSGIDISDYRIDNELSLAELLIKLQDFNINIRLSSIEVGLITKEFLDKIKPLKNFCPHFHLSMQSGSTSVLKRMNRKYTAEEFISATKLIKMYYKDATITTDIIVGFPGETDAEFNETLNTVNEIKFAYMHIFPYSRRSGTSADKLISSKLNKDFYLIAPEIIKERATKLGDINRIFHKEFNKKQIGKTLEFLPEEKVEDFYVGHSKNFVKIYVPAKMFATPPTKIFNVKITGLINDGVLGKIKK